jgi:hypothetical protein
LNWQDNSIALGHFLNRISSDHDVARDAAPLAARPNG